MACRRRIGLVISNLTTAIYINGEVPNTISPMVCIAMISQLRLGRNLSMIKMMSLSLRVSLRVTPILVQSSRMEIGYYSQDGTAIKTQIKFGA